MLALHEAQSILEQSDLIHSAQDMAQAIARLADDITRDLSGQVPLVLAVMGGAVVFAGQLLPQLRFPLDFDYVHATRYREATSGGDLHWRVHPNEKIKGRTVLLLDDILDEGLTLAAIRSRLQDEGAAACYTAVAVEKLTGRDKPIRADYVGLTVPNRYVFGYGMDVKGAWRNLPEVRAVQGL